MHTFLSGLSLSPLFQDSFQSSSILVEKHTPNHPMGSDANTVFSTFTRWSSCSWIITGWWLFGFLSDYFCVGGGRSLPIIYVFHILNGTISGRSKLICMDFSTMSFLYTLVWKSLMFKHPNALYISNDLRLRRSATYVLVHNRIWFICDHICSIYDETTIIPREGYHPSR